MVPQFDENDASAVTASATVEESALDVPHDMPEIPTAPSPVPPPSPELLTNAPEEAAEAEKIVSESAEVSDVSVPLNSPSNVPKTSSASSKNECEDLNKTFDVSSDGSGTGSDNDDGWDENDPVKKVEGKSQSKKRVFYRRLLCAGAVAVACFGGGIAVGLAIVNGNNAQVGNDSAQSTVDNNSDDKDEEQTGLPDINLNSPSANSGIDDSEPTLCAAMNEKAVDCGANPKPDRHTFCCPGLVCQVDRHNVYPKYICVEPPTEPTEVASDGVDDTEPTEVVSDGVSDTEDPEIAEEEVEITEADGVDVNRTKPMDDEVNENSVGEATEDDTTTNQETTDQPIVLQDEEFCGTDRVRAVECGNEPNENRPSKCCHGYICKNAERDSFAPVCAIDPNGPLASSLTVLDDPKAYQPGHLLTTKNGLLLSAGLDCRVLATKGLKVKQLNKDKTKVLYKSMRNFHSSPDFGATFPTDNGGWVYVSNSEVNKGGGGVGALKFDKNGNVIDYRMLLKGTSMNCGGGELISFYRWSDLLFCFDADILSHLVLHSLSRRSNAMGYLDIMRRSERRRSDLGGPS